MTAIVPSPEPPTASPFDALRRVADDGREYWSARDLCLALRYTEWRVFEEAVERARAASANSGHNPLDHFVADHKMTMNARGQQRKVSDSHLSRLAAYLVAMNGDPRKPEIAAAQTYFAVKTRETEVREAVQPPAVMPSHAEALRAWADELERRQLAEAKVAELEPAARSWEVLASSGQDFAVREAAYILNRDPQIDMRQNRLFQLIREVWRMVDSQDRPYAQHRRRLHLKPQSYTNRATGEEVPAKPQIRVSVEGLNYMHRKLGGVVDVRRHINEFQAELAIEVAQ